MAVDLRWATGDGYTSWGGTTSTSGWGAYGLLRPAPSKTDVQRIAVTLYASTSNQADIVYQSSLSYSNYKLTIGKDIDLPATLHSSKVSFTFNENSKKAMCQYIREKESRDVIDFDVYIWGYDAPNKNWVELAYLDSTIQAHNTQPSFSYNAGELVKHWVLTEKEDPLAGYPQVFLTQYNYPERTWRMTVDWVTTKVKVTPHAGWLNVSPIEKAVGYTGEDLITITGTFNQGAAYPDSAVGNNVIGDTRGTNIPLGVDFSDNFNKSYTVSQISALYKFISMTVEDNGIWRATEDGKQSVEGNYLAAWFNLDYNPMHQYSTYQGEIVKVVNTYNPLTIHITVKKLLTKEVVSDETYTVTSASKTGKDWDQKVTDWDDLSWVSKDVFELGGETSYFVTVVISDLFRTRTFAANIGTKPAFIEWGPADGHMAIGKYIETDGLEVQWDTIFNRSCIFLDGSNLEKLGDAAAAIPYNDTYSIGARNVQEALNWIFGRLN